MAITAVITIGNSDDKLSQRRWSNFWHEVDSALRTWAKEVHGSFVSESNSPWQNASWVVDLDEEQTAELVSALGVMARDFEQDSIALTLGRTTLVEAAR